MSTCRGEITRDHFEVMGGPWPPPSEDTGRRRLSRCTEIRCEKQVQQVQQVVGPARPDREVPVAWETVVDADGEEDDYVSEWRTLSDAEYAEAMATYEKASAEFRRTGGLHFVKTGPDIVTATFVAEDGSIGVGRCVDSKWIWIEWRSA